jgi:hypothetical protein
MKAHTITSTLIAATLLLAPLGMAFAKDKEDSSAIKGHVTAVDPAAQTISIACGKKSATPGKQTISVTASTVINVDGKTGTLADIKPKMGAKVTLAADGKSAAQLMVKSPKSAGGSGAEATKPEEK